MDRRLNRIRDHIEKDGIDACVFTSYHNIYYFSDFLYCSMGRQYAMIVTDEKAITITPCKYASKVALRITCMGTTKNIRQYDDMLIGLHNKI